MKIIILALSTFILFMSSKNEFKQNKIKENSNNSDTCVYLFKNDTIYQKIKLLFLKERIYYEYTIKNLHRRLEVTLKNYANKIESINMELGEDEEGNAYSVNLFEFRNGDCWIGISVDDTDKDKVTVSETPECTEHKSQYLPVSSIGIMRKVK